MFGTDMEDLYKPSPQWDAWDEIPETYRRGLVVIVGCGREKLTRPAPAGQMYVGSFHRLCMETAESMRPDLTLILSAKHGLLLRAAIIQPYDTRIGDPDAIQPDRIERQAKRLFAIHADLVVVLAGRAYVELARTVWPKAAAPLLGASGIGEMRSILTKLRDRR